jgi:hypothetical protein
LRGEGWGGDGFGTLEELAADFAALGGVVK